MPQFSNYRHEKLHPDPHYDSYWYNHTNQDCAERCLNERGFVCRGYYYNVTSRSCILSASNQFSWDVTGKSIEVGVNFYEREINCSKDMGVTNPTVVLDAWFSASSNNVSASSARLLQREDGLYRRGWQANETDQNHWLQVDMRKIIRLTGLHLNGDGKKNYVDNLTVAASLDGKSWVNCCGAYNPMYLNGSTQAKIPETIFFPTPLFLDGRYFR